MANNKKKQDTIVISKDKLLKGIGITVGVLLLVVVSFALSANNSEAYQESSTTTEESSGDDVLQLAIKQAGEISDDERTSPKEITIDEYLDIYNGSSQKLVLISRPTCQYCQIATPILENIIYNYGVEINYLNTDEFDDDANSKFVSSDEYFSEGYGTPMLLLVGNGKLVDQVDGLTTRDEYLSFLKKYGWGD